MTTQDNKLPTLVTGQANWDSDLDAAIAIIEQGYHITEHAGVAINTGQVLWMNSGGFFFPFDPNSLSIDPMALAYTAASSGDSLTALAWGIVRSLDVASFTVPGQHIYVSAATPGTMVQSSGIRDRPVGIGLLNHGVLFNPSLVKRRLAAMWDVDSTNVASGTVPMWSNASSKFVMVAVAGAGASALAGLTDVDTTGVASGSVLGWSNASSKWTPRTLAIPAVGSPPSVVQVAFSTGRNDVTFATTPSSGNLLVAMGFNPGADTLTAVWSKAQENTSGLDFGVMGLFPLTTPVAKTQTLFAASNAADAQIVWEITGGKGVPPTFVAFGGQAEQAGFQGASAQLPNLADTISLSALCLASAAASLTGMFNVHSSAFVNSGVQRQICGGWAQADTPLAQILTTHSQSASNKALVALFQS